MLSVTVVICILSLWLGKLLAWNLWSSCMRSRETLSLNPHYLPIRVIHINASERLNLIRETGNAKFTIGTCTLRFAKFAESHDGYHSQDLRCVSKSCNRISHSLSDKMCKHVSLKLKKKIIITSEISINFLLYLYIFNVTYLKMSSLNSWIKYFNVKLFYYIIKNIWSRIDLMFSSRKIENEL